jgi:hypothetical protein
MGGKSEPPPAPTQSTTYQLSPEQRELMNLAMPGLRSFAANVPQRYPGDTVAGFTPAQTTGQQMALDAAGAQSGIAKTAADVFTALPSQLAQSVPGLQPFVGQTQTYETNPFAGLPQADPALASYIDASTRPLYQQLTESVLPNVRGSAITAGGFGGSRQGIAEGLAAGRTAQAAGDTASKLAGSQYATNVGALQNRYATNIGAEQARYATNVQAEQNRLALMEQARRGDITALTQLLALTPTVQGAQVQPALTTSGVGDVQQSMDQARIQAALQGFNYDQLAPFLQSKELLSLIQGIPGGTTLATGSVPPQPSTLNRLLGGAATGAALGSAIPGIGTGIGAVGGAVLPFLMG